MHVLLRRLEEALTYHPDRVSDNSLEPFGLTYGAVSDRLGNSISFAYRHKPPQPFVLFSHGNRGNITTYQPYYELFDQLGVSYLTYDFPGYGQSTGSPNEAGLYASFEAIHGFVTQELAIPTNQIVLFGLSLGAAVTLDAAAKGVSARRIVAESPFTSTYAMGRWMFYGIPIYRLTPNRFNSLAKVSKITTPILYIHGDRDRTTPVRHSLELFEATSAPKELYLVPGAGHTDQWEVGGEEYLKRLKKFVDSG